MKLTLAIPDETWKTAARIIRPLQLWNTASPVLRMWQAMIQARWADYDRARADLDLILQELDAIRAQQPSRRSDDPGWTR